MLGSGLVRVNNGQEACVPPVDEIMVRMVQLNLRLNIVDFSISIG